MREGITEVSKYNARSRYTKERSCSYKTLTTLPVTPLMQRQRVPKAPPLLPLQMPFQRIAPAKCLPAPPNHQHPVELERLRLPHDRGWYAQFDRVQHGYPAAHPVRTLRVARVRPDVPLEVGRAAVMLDVGAVGTLPGIGCDWCGGARRSVPSPRREDGGCSRGGPRGRRGVGSRRRAMAGRTATGAGRLWTHVGRVVVLTVVCAIHSWTYDVWGNACRGQLGKRMLACKRDGRVAGVGEDTLQIECDGARRCLWGRLGGRGGVGTRPLVVTTYSARGFGHNSGQAFSLDINLGEG